MKKKEILWHCFNPAHIYLLTRLEKCNHQWLYAALVTQSLNQWFQSIGSLTETNGQTGNLEGVVCKPEVSVQKIVLLQPVSEMPLWYAIKYQPMPSVRYNSFVGCDTLINLGQKILKTWQVLPTVSPQITQIYWSFFLNYGKII